MSSIPGYTLEDFLAWNFDVVVNDNETNFSGMKRYMLKNKLTSF